MVTMIMVIPVLSLDPDFLSQGIRDCMTILGGGKQVRQSKPLGESRTWSKVWGVGFQAMAVSGYGVCKLRVCNPVLQLAWKPSARAGRPQLCSCNGGAGELYMQKELEGTQIHAGNDIMRHHNTNAYNTNAIIIRLWMEEILHPVYTLGPENGSVLGVVGGAGFPPSTVVAALSLRLHCWLGCHKVSQTNLPAGP